MSREYPTAVVLSLSSGRMLCDFSAMQEFAEFLTGGSVFTHQFAHQPFVDEMKAALVRQHPALADFDADAVTRDNWKKQLKAAVASLGETLVIQPMAEAPKHLGAAFTEPLKLIGTKS